MVNTTSTILDDIIHELELTYDSSVGLLDGDNVRLIPNSNTLVNLTKLLHNLSKDLKNTETIDSKIISILDGKISKGEEEIAKAEQAEDTTKTQELNKDKKNDKEKKGLKRDIENDEDVEIEPKKQKIKPIDEIQEIEQNEERNEEDNEQANDELELDEKMQNETQESDNIEVEVKEENVQSMETDENVIKSEVEKMPVTKSLETEKQSKEDNEGQEEPERLNSSTDPVPPIQSGHYTQENDTRLKNPKSEFVKPQTVSASAIAALGLFSEDNNGFETHGKEYLKKKYGVASYPENDLQDLLPGKIPNIDFSKNKPPSNQVQFTTFQSYIESFYRLFSQDDLKFLAAKNIIPPGFEKQDYDPDVSPYIIPKLGQFYADAWSEEDASLANKLNSPAFQQPSLDTYKPKGSMNDLDEDKLATEDISCGPLSSRLLSAVLSIHERVEDNADYEENKPENIMDDGLDDNIATNLKVDPDFDASTESNDFHSIEERLKRELKYIGIFMNLPNEDEETNKKLSLNGRSIKSETRPGSIIDNDDWVKNKEDDEVSAEIRMLQKQLKEAVKRNRLNKKKLIPIVEEQIAYQEYCTILEDLDKQVDQAYMKRLKSKGKKKKTTEKVELTAAQQQAMNAGVRSTLDKRKRWIENIGKLFQVPEIMKRVPSESVLEGDLEEEVDEEVNDVAQDVIQDRS